MDTNIYRFSESKLSLKLLKVAYILVHGSFVRYDKRHRTNWNWGIMHVKQTFKIRNYKNLCQKISFKFRYFKISQFIFETLQQGHLTKIYPYFFVPFWITMSEKLRVLQHVFTAEFQMFQKTCHWYNRYA